MSRWVPWAVAFVLVASLAAGLGFLAGQHHRAGMTVLTGSAYVGIDEATITVGGQAYGLEGVGSVMWVDSQGTDQTGSWPACLHGPGTVPSVTFGEVPVTAPDGSSWNQVVWVDCRTP